jgi:hypothetical protein
MTRVEELWNEISARPSPSRLFRRIDESHPLDLYAGIDHQGKRVLLLISDVAPPTLPAAGVVEITANQRADREFAVVLQVGRQEYAEIFGRLCQDLVDFTRDAVPQNGAEALLRRVARWRKLLEFGQSTILSGAALRGLVGELWFLRFVALDRVGTDLAIKSWVGPFEAPQDFVFDDLAVEIKALSPGLERVTISSMQQLHAADIALFLAVVILAPADQNAADTFTVGQLVRSVRDIAGARASALLELELRLAEAGYSDHEEYERTWYRVTHVRYFNIRGDFPRLTREQVPAGILDTTYTIDLGACKAYELPLPREMNELNRI